VNHNKENYSALYDFDNPGPYSSLRDPKVAEQRRNQLYRECATWAILQALIWVWVDLWRALVSYVTDASTVEERKARKLAEARKIIAEYEIEQQTKRENKWARTASQKAPSTLKSPCTRMRISAAAPT
jgi:hypothetical protein